MQTKAAPSQSFIAAQPSSAQFLQAHGQKAVSQVAQPPADLEQLHCADAQTWAVCLWVVYKKYQSEG
jgi:hypothetical protein